MEDMVFEAKLRKVGDSMGVLIPGAISKKRNWKPGKRLTVAILEKDLDSIEEAFGSAKGTAPFVRDKTDRTF